MAIETLTELMEPSMRTRSFSLRLTVNGVSRSSRLLLEREGERERGIRKGGGERKGGREGGGRERGREGEGREGGRERKRERDREGREG